MISPIEQDYRRLLDSHGLGHVLRPPAPGSARLLLEMLSESEREYLGDALDEINDITEYVNPLAEADHKIRHSLTAGGIELPTPVFVGEFPHHQYNAQAMARASGTLILLNTGLSDLLDRVGTAFAASMLTFTTLDSGEVITEQATTDQRQSRDDAKRVLAESLVAYLSGNRDLAPPRIRAHMDNRGMLGHLLFRSAETFVIGHEYGHLLAGHLHGTAQPRGTAEWTAESLRREYEADELSALLLLRGMDDSKGRPQMMLRMLTVAGPFVFLAVEHLVNRVRNEVYDLPAAVGASTHPPSDARAAALRTTFTEVGNPNELQVADAAVIWLSMLQDEVVDTARRLLPDTRP